MNTSTITVNGSHAIEKGHVLSVEVSLTSWQKIKRFFRLYEPPLFHVEKQIDENTFEVSELTVDWGWMCNQK